MGYSDAEVEPLAQRMVALLPGLDIRLARVWIKSESGANNNPLGVTASKGSSAPVGQYIGPSTYLIRYPSREAGIDGAVALIKRSSNYAGIRASLGQPVNVQAAAVIASPWHARNSPYYTKVFTQAGLLVTRGIAPLVGGDGATLASAPAPNVWTYLGKRPSDVFTQADYDKLIAGYKDVGMSDPERIIGATLRPYLGRPLNTIPPTFRIDSQHPAFSLVPNSALRWLQEETPLGTLGDIAGNGAALLAALLDSENWAYIGAIVIGVPAALFGFYLLAGVQTGGQNA